jgi:hypothetical protein
MKRILFSLLLLLACAGISSASIGVWQPQGIVITSSSDYPGQPNVFYASSGCVVISSPCFEVIFSTAASGVDYAECTVATPPVCTRYSSNPVISETSFGANPYARVFKNGSTYYLYGSGGVRAAAIQAWTASSLTGTWTQQNATAISKGTTGQWDADGVMQLNVAAVVGGTWYGYYAVYTPANNPGWSMGLATSSNGTTWTKQGTSAAITAYGPSNFCWQQVGSTYYGWSQILLPNIPGNSSNEVPSDIMRFSASSPSGPWTALGTTTYYRNSITNEGMDLLTGQVGDPSIVSDGTNLWMFYSSNSTGGAWQISAAKAPNTTFAQLVQSYEGVYDIPIPWAGKTNTPLNLSQVASDNFQRANQNPLSGNWTRISTSGNFTTAELTSDLVYPTTTNTVRASYYWNPASWNADQWSSVTLASLAVNASTFGGAVRESTSGAATEYVGGIYGTASGDYRIQSIISGTVTALVTSTAAGVSPASGDIITCTIVGSQISVYYNGFLIGTVSDSNIASGASGFTLYSASSVTDSEMSGWAGGSIQAAPLISNGGQVGAFLVGP